MPQKGVAQYNRNYIYWVGQQCMVDNKYREAIDILNVLIRQDERNFDAYFLRGIAKYNMDGKKSSKSNRKHLHIKTWYDYRY